MSLNIKYGSADYIIMEDFWRKNVNVLFAINNLTSPHTMEELINLNNAL
jgi:hypothetical protein